MSRFRTDLTLYEQETNIDLIQGLFEKVSEELKKIYLGTSLMRRVDSIMISGGCRHLSRLQLAHTVNRNALFTLKKADVDMEIPEGLEHYLNEFDENQVTYHSDKPQDEKLLTAFQDAVQIEQLFTEELKTTEDYAYLTRFSDEQIVLDETGSFQAIRGGKTLTSTTMYNPVEPEGTIRKKAGETHFGYVGCFAETVDQDINRKIIDSCDFKPNIHSETKFGAEELGRTHENGDTNILVGDGGFISQNLVYKAESYDIQLIGTDLTGKDTPDQMAYFTLDEETQEVVCPAGYKADRVSQTKDKESYHVSFFKDHKCSNCPHQKTCPLTSNKRVFSGKISRKQINRARTQRMMETEEFKKFYCFRNGVEAIPSQRRRVQRIDEASAPGFLRKKLWYTMAIIGINIRRAIRYGLEDGENSLIKGGVRPEKDRNHLIEGETASKRGEKAENSAKISIQILKTCEILIDFTISRIFERIQSKIVYGICIVIEKLDFGKVQHILRGA